jgi:hypothetical protein
MSHFRTRYMAFIKSAAWQFQQMRQKKEADKRKETEEKETVWCFFDSRLLGK